MTELDLTTEEFRVYTYEGGRRFIIANPATLYIITDEKGTTHRVVDVDGVTHRPERGWVGISWKPREGQPDFVA